MIAPFTAPFTAPVTAPVAAPAAAPTGPPAESAIAPFTAPFTAPFFAPFTAPFFAPSIAPFTSIVAVTFMPNIDTDLVILVLLSRGLRLLRWSLSIPLKTISSPTLHLSISSRCQYWSSVFIRLATSSPKTPENLSPTKMLVLIITIATTQDMWPTVYFSACNFGL